MTNEPDDRIVDPPRVPRLAAIDAYRGLVMFLMMAEVLDLSRVAKLLPENGFWSFLATTRATSSGRAAPCTT